MYKKNPRSNQRTNINSVEELIHQYCLPNSTQINYHLEESVTMQSTV
jgi:hypothetical protein